MFTRAAQARKPEQTGPTTASFFCSIETYYNALEPAAMLCSPIKEMNLLIKLLRSPVIIGVPNALSVCSFWSACCPVPPIYETLECAVGTVYQFPGPSGNVVAMGLIKYSYWAGRRRAEVGSLLV